MKKIKITQQLLDENKWFRDLGLKVGSSLEYSFVPSVEKTNEQSNEGNEDDGGIEVPKKTPPPQP